MLSDHLTPPTNPDKIGIYHIPIPEGALDGYTKTCSRTCYDCEDNNESGFGLWLYRFPSSQTVSEVHILACRDGWYLSVMKTINSCPEDDVTCIPDWDLEV